MVGTVCGVALAAGLATLARADEWNKLTVLNVDKPIQVGDKLLEPGQYVFKLLDSNSDRNTVQIFNADRSQLIATVMAIPNYRLVPTDSSRFAFWETPPEDAPALRAWFYPGDNVGQEFPYPKHLVALGTNAAARSEEAQAQPPAESQTPVPPAPEESAEQPPACQPCGEANRSAEQAPERPAETPENEAPQAHAPAPPPPAVSPDVQEQTSPELPHTASLYPLMGLAGFAALGLSGLLRRKRSM
jgi:LPXTG-motif cell wall-anchored protein